MFSGKDQKSAQELLEAIKFFNQKGWSPATSTNYSTRSEHKDQLIISRSGVDKSQFSFDDLILINSDGVILPPYNVAGVKSSAETEIHTEIYKLFPEVNCVLHTHSVLATVLSMKYASDKKITFDGYEILKGLECNLTHELHEDLPIVPNSQVMSEILYNMKDRYKNTHGFLIAGHGLYTWGKSVAAAKRHVETFEFLFECYFAMRSL